MRIAIVDDIAADRSSFKAQLHRAAEQKGLRFSEEEFSSGEAFLNAFCPGIFDAVFLDIYMNKISGMDAARVIFEQDPDCRIVFLTTSDEFLLESYSVRATYYLLKPVEPERLMQALEFCFPLHKKTDTLPVRTKNGTVIIPKDDIIYIESVGRLRCIHTKDGIIETADRFSDVIAPLESDRRFLSCGRGIMLHMAHISSQEKSDFIMTDGARLPIPRRSRNEILSAFKVFALEAMEVVI